MKLKNLDRTHNDYFLFQSDRFYVNTDELAESEKNTPVISGYLRVSNTERPSGGRGVLKEGFYLV